MWLRNVCLAKAITWVGIEASAYLFIWLIINLVFTAQLFFFFYLFLYHNLSIFFKFKLRVKVQSCGLTALLFCWCILHKCLYILLKYFGLLTHPFAKSLFFSLFTWSVNLAQYRHYPRLLHTSKQTLQLKTRLLNVVHNQKTVSWFVLLRL